MSKQDKINEAINKEDQKWLLKTQQQTRHDIRGLGAQVWRPGSKKIVCKNCFYEGKPLESDEIRGNGFSTYIAHCETPVCNKPGSIHVVRWPYEMCKDRLEKPKIPIDKW